MMPQYLKNNDLCLYSYYSLYNSLCGEKLCLKIEDHDKKAWQ